jgi:hypothetical protein
VADPKLGPLPKQSTVRLAIVLSELLKEELDAYAAEHSRLYEPVETKALIPHMLEAFLRADRARCSSREQRGQQQNGRRRAPNQRRQLSGFRRIGSMTKPLPFTEAVVRRAIAAACKERLPIAATTIAPDGTVTIHHQGIAPPVVPEQNDKEADNWANA